MVVSYFLCPQSLRVSFECRLCISYGGYSWDSHKKKIHHLVYVSINKQGKGLCLESKVQTLLDSVRWDDKGLAVAIAQNVDTGAILMQGFANRDAVTTAISSRKILYLGKPDGPTCHPGSETRYYTSVFDLKEHQQDEGNKLALSTLYSLGSTISQRKAELAAEQNGKPSSTKRLLLDNKLLCSKIREEADELCRTLEENEGKSRTASEMAYVLYHAMVLLANEDVKIEDVMQVLRQRFSQSGVTEKRGRISQGKAWAAQAAQSVHIYLHIAASITILMGNYDICMITCSPFECPGTRII